MKSIQLFRAYYHATPQEIQRCKGKVRVVKQTGPYVRRVFADPDGKVLMVGWFIEGEK